MPAIQGYDGSDTITSYDCRPSIRCVRPSPTINPGNAQHFNKAVIDTNWEDFVPGAGGFGVTKHPALNVFMYVNYDYAWAYAELNNGRHGSPRTGMRDNVLFCDGHAESMDAKTVTTQYHYPPAGMPANSRDTRLATNNMFNLILP